MIRKLLPAATLLLAAALPADLPAATRHMVSLETGAPAEIRVTDLTENCTQVAKAVRVTVTNNASYPVSYVATLQSSAGEAVSRTITTPANATRSADITATLDPAVTTSWMNTSVSFTGPGARGYASVGLNGAHSGKSYSTVRQIALSPSLHTNYASRLSKSYETSGTGFLCSELAPAEISADWRALRAFDAIVLTGDDWRHAVARPETREALLRYAGQGGRIRILTDAKDAPPALPGTGDSQSYGFGRITVFRIAAESAVKAVEASTFSVNAATNPFSTSALRNDSATPSAGPGSNYRALDSLLPAAARAGIGVLLIITLFSILVGPVNLFVFCRGARRHRMIWLTPAIALVTSLLLSGYIVVADGVGGEGHRRILRMRPAGTTAEFITQEQSSRTGLLLGSSFTLPEGSLLWHEPKPDASHPFRYNEHSTRREVDGHASGEWFRSRYTQAQTLEMWDAARGEVTLAGTADAPEILSSLDGTLDIVFVRTADNRVWRAEKVAPGARVRLTRSGAAEFDTWFDETGKQCGKTQAERLRFIESRPGTYFAQSSNLRATSPETLDSIRWTNLPDIIVGDIDTH